MPLWVGSGHFSPLELDEGKVSSTGREASEHARTMWADDGKISWERDLLTMFVRNQLRVSLALPLLAVLFALTSLVWTSWVNSAVWLACLIASQGVQLYLCRHYEQLDTDRFRMSEWIGMLAASELLYAASWSMSLFLFWDAGNDMQHVFLIATLMAVVAIRIIIACNFMPVVIAGTGFITFFILLFLFD